MGIVLSTAKNILWIWKSNRMFATQSKRMLIQKSGKRSLPRLISIRCRFVLAPAHLRPTQSARGSEGFRSRAEITSPKLMQPPCVGFRTFARFQSRHPCEGSETFARDRGSYFIYDPYRNRGEYGLSKIVGIT